MAKWAKRLVGAGLLAGVGYALWRVLDERVGEQDLTWTPQPFPMPPKPEIPETPDPRPGAGTEAEAEAEAQSGTRADAAADPSVAAAASVATEAPAWVDPLDGACPVSHPVKAKLGSGIFHVPGGQMYERTVPDRCYVNPAAAEADGLRASKR